MSDENSIKQKDTESQFGLDELFFSHADAEGRILFGNDLFARVSEYSLDELVGSPHSVVRHPDMPRAIFHRFWAELKSGNRFVGYIKNKTKSGKQYWVLALVVPFERGYLSIRMKPTSDLFKSMSGLYRHIKAFETLNENSVEAGSQMLTEALSELGFCRYQDLMTEALVRELESRSRILGSSYKLTRNWKLRTLQDTLNSLSQIAENSRRLDLDAERVTKVIREIDEITPKAGTRGIEPAGTLGGLNPGLVSLTQGLSEWAHEVRSWITDFVTRQAELKTSLRQAQNQLGFARLESEMALVFAQAPTRNQSYTMALQKLAQTDTDLALQSVAEFRQVFDLYARSLDRLRVSLLKLKTLRTTLDWTGVQLFDGQNSSEMVIQGLTRFLESVDVQAETIRQVMKSSLFLLNEVPGRAAV